MTTSAPSGRTAAQAAFAHRMREAIHDAKYDHALLDQLEKFGEILIDEMTSRVETIETKAVSIAGWATALIGFLLVQAPKGRLASIAIIATSLFALAALWSAVEAAKGRKWQQVLSDPANTHVYLCVDHGQFWLNQAVGLTAAPKELTSR